MSNNEQEELIDISTDNMGKALMGVVLQEIKALPKVWQQLSEYDQNEVIDRVRESVKKSVDSAVRLIASKNFPYVVARLESASLKEIVKATFKISRENQSKQVHELYDARGELCQIILSSTADMIGGMDDIKGEKEQKELGLDDPLYDDAYAFVATTGKSSISAIQRHLRIGYARAARLVDILANNNVIDKSKNTHEENHVIFNTDNWEKQINDWLTSIKKDRVLIEEITKDALGINESHTCTQNELRTIGAIMAHLGWEKVRARVEGGRSSGWVKPQ